MRIKSFCLLALAGVLTSLAAPARAGERTAVVGVSAAYLRTAPDYESALETQELMGTVVNVLETDRYWCKVETPQPYTAWCTDRVLVPMEGESLRNWNDSPKYICLAPLSEVLESPRKGAPRLCDLVLCDRMGMVCRKGGQPLRRGNYSAVLLPDGRQGWVWSKDLMREEQWRSARDFSRANLVSFARTFLGTPYLWGGMTPKGFDCSGLVRMVYLRYGKMLPRNASQMARLGREVSVEEALPGDLLFFGTDGKVTHVAMYVGGGRFIHSSHLVRINAINPAEPDVYENIHKLLFCRNLID